MSKSIDDVLKELDPIFSSVLACEVNLTPETTTDDIPEWDSVAHIELVAEISKTYGVKFTTQEISLWENAGDIAASLLSKTSRA